MARWAPSDESQYGPLSESDRASVTDDEASDSEDRNDRPSKRHVDLDGGDQRFLFHVEQAQRDLLFGRIRVLC